MAHSEAGKKCNQPFRQLNSRLSRADSPRMMHSKGFSPPQQMFPEHRMLSIFILFMQDLCVADQIFSCCNQTCLVRCCQGRTRALKPRLPLPSAAQAPLPLQATPAAWRPRAGGKPRRCAACGTASPDRLCCKECFPAGGNITLTSPGCLSSSLGRVGPRICQHSGGLEALHRAAGLGGARPPCSTARVAWAEILPLRNICMDIAVKPCACFIILALQCSS